METNRDVFIYSVWVHEKKKAWYVLSLAVLWIIYCHQTCFMHRALSVSKYCFTNLPHLCEPKGKLTVDSCRLSSSLRPSKVLTCHYDTSMFSEIGGKYKSYNTLQTFNFFVRVLGPRLLFYSFCSLQFFCIYFETSIINYIVYTNKYFSIYQLLQKMERLEAHFPKVSSKKSTFLTMLLVSTTH